MRANGRAACCDCRYLQANNLTGPIPPEVSKLTRLIHLCVVLFLHDAYGCMRMLCVPPGTPCTCEIAIVCVLLR